MENHYRYRFYAWLDRKGMFLTCKIYGLPDDFIERNFEPQPQYTFGEQCIMLVAIVPLAIYVGLDKVRKRIHQVGFSLTVKKPSDNLQLTGEK